MGGIYWKHFLSEFSESENLGSYQELLLAIGIEGVLERFESWLRSHDYLK